MGEGEESFVNTGRPFLKENEQKNEDPIDEKLDQLDNNFYMNAGHNENKSEITNNSIILNEDEVRKMQPRKPMNKQENYDLNIESLNHSLETPEKDKLEKLYQNTYYREISSKTISWLKIIMIKGCILSLFFLLYQKFPFTEEYVLFLALAGFIFLNFILVFILNFKKIKKKNKISELVEHIGVLLLLVRKKSKN